jgi:hypothetical protein
MGRVRRRAAGALPLAGLKPGQTSIPVQEPQTGADHLRAWPHSSPTTASASPSSGSLPYWPPSRSLPHRRRQRRAHRGRHPAASRDRAQRGSARSAGVHLLPKHAAPGARAGPDPKSRLPPLRRRQKRSRHPRPHRLPHPKLRHPRRLRNNRLLHQNPPQPRLRPRSPLPPQPPALPPPPPRSTGAPGSASS